MDDKKILQFKWGKKGYGVPVENVKAITRHSIILEIDTVQIALLIDEPVKITSLEKELGATKIAVPIWNLKPGK